MTRDDEIWGKMRITSTLAPCQELLPGEKHAFGALPSPSMNSASCWILCPLWFSLPIPPATTPPLEGPGSLLLNNANRETKTWCIVVHLIWCFGLRKQLATSNQTFSRNRREGVLVVKLSSSMNSIAGLRSEKCNFAGGTTVRPENQTNR